MKAQLLAILLCGVSTAAQAQQVPIAVTHGRIFVPAEIAGRSIQALLDSGAEMTLVDQAYAREIGLAGSGGETVKGSGGEAAARFAENVTLRVAGRTLSGLTVAILDLSDISRRLNGGTPIRLIVGREFFDSGRWTIDLSHRTIAAAGRDITPRGARLRLSDAHGIEALPVSVEGLPPVLAAFDLGNGSGVMVGKAYADRVGFMRDGRPQAEEQGGGIGGGRRRTVVTLSRLEVAGRRFRHVRAAIDDSANAEDLNIGTGILGAFRMTVDYAEHLVWLDPIR